MAEVNWGGLNIKWSSLNNQDKKEYGGGLTLMLIASVVSGVILGGIWGERLTGQVDTMTWLYPYMYPFAMLGFIVGAKLMTNFMQRQDEGFVDFNIKSNIYGINFFLDCRFFNCLATRNFYGMGFCFYGILFAIRSWGNHRRKKSL